MIMSSLKIIVTKEFFRMKILLAVIYLLLELYYRYYITEEFKHMLFVWDLNLFKYLISKIVFLFLLVMSWNMYRRSRFLYSIYLLLIFFFYIPNAILYSLGNFPGGPFVSNTFFVSFFLITPYLKISFPGLTFPEKYRGVILFALAILLLIPIIQVFRFNVNMKTLLLADIYETRQLFSDKLDGFVAYFYNLEAKAIIPCALIYFMIRKKYFYISLLFLMLIYLYVISGNKLVYFTSVIVVFFFYVGKDHLSKLNYFFLVVLIAFALFPVLDNLILKAPVLAGTFVNRFLFIPALTTHFYFDFFSGRPFYFAETHLINHFVHSPYNMPVGFLITKEYWNEPTVFANNGIVSDGFMNLGYLGVILFSIVFATLFSLFDSFKIHVGFYGMFFCYIYILLSAPLFTCFITGGILVFIIICITILNDSEKSLKPA